MPTVISAKRARRAIALGVAPSGLLVHGALNFDKWDEVTHLPDDLEVDELRLEDNADLRTLPVGLTCRRLFISRAPFMALPDDLRVSERLDIRDCLELAALPKGVRLHSLCVSGCRRLRALPADLECVSLSIAGTAIAELPADLSLQVLDASNCEELTSLPAGLHITESLTISGCTRLERLPEGLEVSHLTAVGCTRLATLPSDLQVPYSLRLTGCTALAELPPGLKTETLHLGGCTALRELPEGLDARILDISDCAALEGWPRTSLRSLTWLDMRHCRRLRSLPPGVTHLERLDITGCTGLRTLPEDLRVTWMEVAEAGLEAVPPRLESKLHWRGVRVPTSVVLHPERITSRDVLAEENTEVRRVMIERMGYERFMSGAGAVILDEDRDPGGLRQVLRVEIPRDEPLVCLSVSDPSTGRQYVLRVPPNMMSCRQAAAWIAGFDDPDEYRPVVET
jgi:hypothetical protein